MTWLCRIFQALVPFMFLIYRFYSSIRGGDRTLFLLRTTVDVTYKLWYGTYPIVHSVKRVFAPSTSPSAIFNDMLAFGEKYFEPYFESDRPNCSSPSCALPAHGFVAASAGTTFPHCLQMKIYLRFTCGNPACAVVRGVRWWWFNLFSVPQIIQQMIPLSASRKATVHKDRRSCNGCPVIKNEEKMLRCSQCQAAYYCNSVCQAKHWPVHKENCTAFARMRALGMTPSLKQLSTPVEPNPFADVD